ncbi:hypothetical protein SAY87_010834 [Trapa incisa]|uniref:Uncharacterized protein n=1 Tax=Trapa incisa TaxID=236973 RepID=A0AAN7GX10_9MYRT|nr:hypothetical protein SAY87_010834 [Trapa incisa]
MNKTSYWKHKWLLLTDKINSNNKSKAGELSSQVSVKLSKGHYQFRREKICKSLIFILHQILLNQIKNCINLNMEKMVNNACTQPFLGIRIPLGHEELHEEKRKEAHLFHDLKVNCW